MKQKRFKIWSLLTAFTLVSCLINLEQPIASALTRSITFPVIGQANFSNDYDAPRASGPHHAIDILANKGQKLVAAVNGTVTNVNYPEPDWGYSVSIRDSSGFRYVYIHINDDNPGTDDGNGGAMHAYAPYMKPGNPIVKGQLIGWVGNSGFSNGVSHLHFEMYKPNGDVMNPYESLLAAKHLNSPVNPPAMPDENLPFNNRKVGVSVAMGNFDTDPASETVVGAGKGEPPKFKFYDDDDSGLATSQYADSATFLSGIDVAAADFNNDDIDEVVVGRGPSDLPRVKVFKIDGTKLADFKAFSVDYKGGINVATGDIDGDTVPEIIASTNKGDAQVKVFELDGTKLLDFLAYSSKLQGGTDVTAADVSGEGQPEIITGPGSGVAARVKIWSQAGDYLSGFYPYGDKYTHGIRISAANVRPASPEAEIITVPKSGSSSQLKLFNSNGSRLTSDYFLEVWWKGYNDVAAGAGDSKAATGINRRASVWSGLL